MVIKKRISLVSAFPPPMGGAAKNSLRLLNDLECVGFDVCKINTSVSILSHNRAGMYHIKRVLRFLANMIKLFGVLLSGVRVIYIVPDGGLGIVYGVFYTGLVRIFGGHAVFHYRNFSYIDKKSVLLDFILFLFGKNSTHVFLDEYMQKRFSDAYRLKDKINQLIVYNAAYLDFVEYNPFRKTDKSKLVIGHLSNLCYEKGFYDFAKLIDHLNSNIGEEFVEFHIGGEPVGIEEKRLVDKILKNNKNVRFFGHVTGDDKYKFYCMCDIFVFPTRFSQEAQPNVIWEAMVCGAYPLSYDRGSIKWMLEKNGGKTSSPASFLDDCLRVVKSAIEDPVGFSDERKKIRDSAKNFVIFSKGQYSILLNKISGLLSD